jgi:hypothetical protein
MRGRVLFAPLVVAGVVVACSSALPGPRYTNQPTSALSEVPYPPPPARVEAVPKRPAKGAVWIDGEWTWQTRRWSWKPGRWVRPPPDARFAPWTTVRDRVGTLYLASGAWRDTAGNEVTEPEPLAVAGGATPSVVTPEGEEVKQGPEAPLDAGPSSPNDLDASVSSSFDELDGGAAFADDASTDGATMDAGRP